MVARGGNAVFAQPFRNIVSFPFLVQPEIAASRAHDNGACGSNGFGNIGGDNNPVTSIAPLFPDMESLPGIRDAKKLKKKKLPTQIDEYDELDYFDPETGKAVKKQAE